jgi:hypothetical protein
VTLASVRLAQGRAEDALSLAEQAMREHKARGSFGLKGAVSRLVYAEALDAAGDRERAREALDPARERLLATAAKIDDPDLRRSFLENVPENARTLELAARWQGSSPAL